MPVDNQPKLTKKDLQELCYLYEYQGWNQRHLSKKFQISHVAVIYHIRTQKLERKVPVRQTPPEEIKHLYRGRRKRPKTYRDYLREDLERRDKILRKTLNI